MKNDLTLSTKLGVQGIAMNRESAETECENSESKLFHIKNDANAVSESVKKIISISNPKLSKNDFRRMLYRVSKTFTVILGYFCRKTAIYSSVKDSQKP